MKRRVQVRQVNVEGHPEISPIVEMDHDERVVYAEFERRSTRPYHEGHWHIVIERRL